MAPKARLVERLLELAWGQWSALGVAGASAPSTLAVDLEALMILTAELADADPRLRDEALDWCVRNGRFSSKPRLKQLLKRSPASVQVRFAPFARALADHAGGSWPGDETDERWPVRLCGKSRAPDLEHPALIRLKLRALFGVDARADVLASLLPLPTLKFSASDLVFVGYTKRNIADVLDMLTAAGLFRSVRAGNRQVFSWRRHRELAALVKPPEVMPDWARIFRLLSALVELVALGEKKSERVRWVEATKMLRAVAPELEALGVDAPATTIGVTTWEALVDWVSATAAWLTNGGRAAEHPHRVESSRASRS